MTSVEEKPKNEVATVAEGNTDLSTGTIDPFAAAADELGNDFLPILRMTKAGQWVSGPDNDPLEDHEAAFAMHTFARGFVCWKDGEVVDEKMVVVAGGELRPLVGELPDHGPYDNDQDGWAGTASIQGRFLKTDEEFLYRPSSRGGLNALAGLAGKYATRRQRQPNVVPIVRLESKSYSHQQFGEIFNPVLRVIDWQDEPDLIAAASSSVGNVAADAAAVAVDDLNDSIPF